MQQVVIPTMDALVSFLREHAEEIGIPAVNIQRGYNPQQRVEQIAESGFEAPAIVVFLQDCQKNEEEETLATVTTTVSAAVGLMMYAPTSGNDVLDPHVRQFEALRNIFDRRESWSNEEGMGFVIKNAETVDVVNQEILEAKVALSRIDLEIDATVKNPEIE